MTYLIVEWTGAELVASRFLLHRGEPVPQGREMRPAATEGEIPQALRELAPAAGEECRIVLALPLARLFTRELELPIRERRKLRELLPLELRGETVLETEELVFDGVPIGGGKVLAVWGRKRELAHLIGEAASAGAEPEVVTSSPFSWVHLLSEEAKAGTVALADGTALAVYRDGEPVFFRALSGEEGEIDRTLAALELGRGIVAEQLYLFGPLAGAGLASGVSLPVSGPLAEAFGGNEEEAREGAGAWAVVRAVAAGEAVDFRTGELAYTKGRERARRQLRVPAMLAALLVLLLGADAGIRYTLVKRDLASLDASIAAVYREAFPGRKKGPDEVAELRAEIRKLGTGGGSSEVLATLRQLAEAKGDDVNGLYEVEIDGPQVRIKGDARSSQAVTDFRNRLSGILASAEVAQITSKPDGSVSFTLRGSLKEVAK